MLTIYCRGPVRCEETYMIDEMTEDRLRVSTDGVAGPYLMVP